MNIREAKDVLRKYIKGSEKGRPCLFMKGPPGIGKTSIVRQVGEEFGLEVITLIASTKNIVDIEGIPTKTTLPDGSTVVKWSKPYFIPNEGKGIFFIDEINSVPKSMQVALYGLALEGRVGEHKIPDTYIRIAAGNREEDMAVVYKMSSALRTRMCTIEIEPSVDAWKPWAYDNGIHPGIIAFLTNRPDMLYKFDANEKAQTFPTPRGYEMASWWLYNMPEYAREGISGCIGKGAATELIAYMEIYDKVPDIEKILNGDLSQELPDNPSIIYATMAGIISSCTQNPVKERILNGFRYARTKMPVEFQVAALKEFTKSEKVWNMLVKTKEFDTFAKEHGDLFTE